MKFQERSKMPFAGFSVDRCRRTSRNSFLRKSARMFVLLGVLAGGLGLYQASEAQGASPVASNSYIGTGTAGWKVLGYPGQRKLVRDADGYWYAVWGGYTGTPASHKIYINKSTNTAGTAWSIPVVLAGSGGIAKNEAYQHYNVSIDIDRANGKLHVVWQREDDIIYYAKCVNLASWNQSASWKNLLETATGAEAILSSTNHLYLSDAFYAPTLAVDGQGNPHIAYCSNGGGSYQKPYYRTGTTSGGWATAINLSADDVDHRFPVVEIGRYNRAHVAVRYGTNSIYHWYLDSPYTSAMGPTPAMNSAGNSLKYNSMAADGQGTIHMVALEESDNHIWSATHNGSSWTETENMDDGAAWQMPDVGVKWGAGVTDDILVASRAGTSNVGVYYFQWNGSAWGQPETNTNETSDGFVSVEKKSPNGQTNTGYLMYKSGALYIAFVTGLDSGPLAPRAIYTEASGAQNILRQRTHSGSWSAESDFWNTGDASDLRWHTALSSPNGKYQAFLAAGGSNTLYAYLVSSSSFTSLNPGGIYTASYRSFNAAFEQSSGRLLVVASHPSSPNTITYWVHDGATMIVNGATYTFSTLSGNIHWVEMASQPGSNQIALMVLDSNSHTAGLIWNGSSWGNEKKLNSAALPTNTREPIAVKYMLSGQYRGRAVFAWAETNDIYSWTWTGGAWESASKSKLEVTTNNITWLRLAADPNSDKLLLGIVDYDQLYTLPWNGAGWGSVQAVSTNYLSAGSFGGNRPFDVAFEYLSGHTSHAILAYAEVYNGLQYRHTADINGSWSAASPVMNNQYCRWVELTPADDGAIFLTADSGSGGFYHYLYSKRWDHSSWSPASATELESNLNRGTSYQLQTYAVAAVGPAPESQGSSVGTMIGWAQSGTSSLYSSQWNGSSFPTGSAGPTFATGSSWVVNKSNPVRNEKIMAAVAGTTLYASILSGSSWGNQITSPVSTALGRCFDVAVENRSGQVLIVANNNSTGLKYWVWDGSAWIVNGAAYPNSLGAQVYWVRLAAKPGANEIALIAATVAGAVYGAVWNGETNTWGNQQTLAASGLSSVMTEAVGVEYIRAGSQAGHAMFVWGQSSGDVYARRWTGSSWEASAGNTGVWTTASWIVLEADPNSDKLVLCATNTGTSPAVNLGVYAAGAWSRISAANTRTSSERQAYAIFETKPGHEGDIVVIYADGTYFRWKHYDWNGSSYTNDVADQFSSSTTVAWSHMVRTEDGTILVACKDTSNYLKTWSFNGTSWAANTQLSTTMQAWNSYRLDFTITPALNSSATIAQSHYRWRNDDGYEAARGGITVAAVTSGTVQSRTNISLYPTTPSGANRLLLVGISYYSSASASVSSITYNGQSLTPVGSTYQSNYFTAIYMMVNPPVTTALLYIAFSNYVSAIVGAVSLNGVHQTAPIGTYAYGGGWSSNPNVSVPSAPGERVFGVVCSAKNPGSSNADTIHWDLAVQTFLYGDGVTKAGSEPSTSLSWSISPFSDSWSASGVALKPAEPAATWALAEDAKLGIAKNTPKRLRFLVQNSGPPQAIGYQLQVARTASCSNGTYAALGSSAEWQMVDSSFVTNGEQTANLPAGLSDPASMSFIPGKSHDTTDTSGVIGLGTNEFTELEFAVQATSSSVAGGDYCFRLIDATHGAPLGSYQYAQARVLGVTAVRLLSFEATGAGEAVKVGWATGQEVENRGFNLYRGSSPAGPWERLNSRLIPSASLGGEGRDYEFLDPGVARGRIVYYLLEDIDASGTHTRHGPVCVDWDGDGLPDDWEIAYGFDPEQNNADLDPDGDGVPNRLEWARGTDPRNRDSDGDGIPDGEEKKSPFSSGDGGSGPAAVSGTGVTVLAADAGAMTLELFAPACDVTPVSVNGELFERLRVPGLVHGYTLEPGRPQLPVKGLFVALPVGKTARLEILETRTRRLPGFRIYPAPSFREEGTGRLMEVFQWDKDFYAQDLLYPEREAELSAAYVFGGATRQGIRFQPFRFNPATGELLHHERIRVRIHFVDPAVRQASGQTAASFFPRAPASARSGWLPPAGAAYKVKTEGEGIYRLTRADLLAHGLSDEEIDTLDLTGIQLFHEGIEQPLSIRDVNANGRLDDEDRIVFYAATVPAAYAKFSKRGVYWLVDSRDPAARRMAVLDGTPGEGTLAVVHRDRRVHEKDEVYYPQAAGADDLDRWIFATIPMGADYAGGGGWADYGFQLAGAAGAGEVRVRLYSPYDLEHRVTVRLNGVELGEAVWSGVSWHEASFATRDLLDGENTIALRCEVDLDKIAVDRFVVDFDRAFAADQDRLRFTHEGGHRFRIAGFTASEIEVYDITAPDEVRRIVNTQVSGSGPYAMEYEAAQAAGERTYLALSAAAWRSPVAVEPDRPSSLSAAQNGADWILLTHRSLGWQEDGGRRAWVDRLAALRNAKGLRATVVDVEDVFDEFAFGYPAPSAIRDFLAHARANWQAPAPRYLLLVGDASYDFKDNWNFGTTVLLPAPLRYTPHYGETAVDDWYGRPAGQEGLSEIAIGRLPAADALQAAAMAEKIIGYETAANTKSWERRVLLVADDIDASWEAVFETMNEDLAARLPAGFSPERFYLQEYQDESLAVSDLTADFLAAVDTGALWVNYAGHGQQAIWAEERILDHRGAPYRADLAGIENAGRLPWVVNLSCLTGYFLYPEGGWFASDAWRSLAEGFLRPTGNGAVAAFMPTGMTDTVGQQILGNALYEALFLLDRRLLGEAIAYAKEQLLANGGSAQADTADTFLLFGDPAMTLKVPLPRRPGPPAVERAADGAVVLSWAASLDADGRPVAGYHVFRRGEGEGSWSRLTAEPIGTLAYTDAGLSGAAAGSLFFYALTAVDAEGDESVRSEAAILRIPSASTGDAAGGGGGGCFLESTFLRDAGDLLWPLATLALLVLLVGIGGRRRRRIRSDHADDGSRVFAQRGFRFPENRRGDDSRPHPQ